MMPMQMWLRVGKEHLSAPGKKSFSNFSWSHESPPFKAPPPAEQQSHTFTSHLISLNKEQKLSNRIIPGNRLPQSRVGEKLNLITNSNYTNSIWS